MKDIIKELKKIASRNELEYIVDDDVFIFGDSVAEIEESRKIFSFQRQHIESNHFVAYNFMTYMTMFNCSADTFMDNAAGLVNVRFCISSIDMGFESIVIMEEIFGEVKYEMQLDDAFKALGWSTKCIEEDDVDKVKKRLDKIRPVDILYLYYIGMKECFEGVSF